MSETRSASRPPVVLTIAGSDPTGGAGIQADLSTLAALGVLGWSVLTALTVQSGRGVRAVHPVDPELVLAQLDCLLETPPAPAAVKLGRLATPGTVRAVGARLAADGLRAIPVVLDPVMWATGGGELLAQGGVAALKEVLLPRVEVLTPNLDEAAALLGCPVGEILTRPERACRQLAALGPRAVVLKGGHAGGSTSEDLVLFEGELTRLLAERVDTPHDHGTGCVFASALAAHLARGRDPVSATRGAKEAVTRGLRAVAGRGPEGSGGPAHGLSAVDRGEARTD